MNRRTRWMIALAACVLLVSVGAACGDDDKKDGKTPVASATAAAGTTPAASATASTGTTTAASGTVINVILNEFSVAPEKDTVQAGKITFRAKNEGPEDSHEMVIIRSDLAPAALPTATDGHVPEESVDVVDEIAELAVGASGELTVDLKAGKYVLICNVVQTEADGTIESHYQKGMRRSLTVE
jgi:uncharacterized cupredoxin-like copper-binding protein